MKRIKTYIISIILTLIIFLGALYFNKIYPFGNYDFARLDGYFQYKPFLFYFINSLKTGTLTNYSFLSVLGNPTIFLFIYYLASPINLIALFFNNPNSMFFSVILTKILLSNITANYYFYKKTNNETITIISSLCYTFCGWLIAYYFSNMWLDAFIMLPLFQLGLEELINNKKYLLYIISLSYIMLTNFYMAFTICLYTLVYYIATKIIKKEKYSEKIKNFDLIFISTIVTCLISSFIIYATYSTFLKMGIIVNEVGYASSYVKLADLVKALLAGVTNINPGEDTYGFPNLSSSIIVTISLFYFFINKKIPKGEKIRNLIYLILIVILIKSDYLNYVANCFHTPVGFSYRYSFIISFYFLRILIRNFQTFENKFDKRIYIIILLLLIITILEYHFNGLYNELVAFNICILLSYAIYMFFYTPKKYYKAFLIILVTAELTMSAIPNLSTTKDLETYDIQNYKAYKERIDDRKTNISDSINLNYYNNQSNISNFSSMQYGGVMKTLTELGCPSDYRATIYTCNNTDLFNMLFNVKNDYYLEKIYATKYSEELEYEYTDTDMHEFQNKLAELLTGIDGILIEEKIPREKIDNYYQYTIKNNKKYYIQKNFNIKRIETKNEIYTNPKQYDNQIEDKNLNEFMQITAELSEGDTIKIEFIDEKKNKEIKIYSLDQEKLNKAYEYLKDNQINYSLYEYNHLEGTITLEENEILFTTIPYDESWKIKIDGQEVKPFKTLNSLMAIKAPKGTHHISLEYKNNFIVPIIISISSLILTIIFYIVQKKKKK